MTLFVRWVKTQKSIDVSTAICETAGQSILHVHIHLIPSHKGDVENPGGGVKGMILGEQNY